MSEGELGIEQHIATLKTTSLEEKRREIVKGIKEQDLNKFGVWDFIAKRVLEEGFIPVLRTQESLLVPDGPAPATVLISGTKNDIYLTGSGEGINGYVYMMKPGELGPIFLEDAMTFVGDQVPNNLWLGGAEGRSSYQTTNGINIHHSSKVDSIKAEDLLKESGLPADKKINFGGHNEVIAEFNENSENKVIAVLSTEIDEKWKNRSEELGVGLITIPTENGMEP